MFECRARCGASGCQFVTPIMEVALAVKYMQMHQRDVHTQEADIKPVNTAQPAQQEEVVSKPVHTAQPVQQEKVAPTLPCEFEGCVYVIHRDGGMLET